jgi:8-oxo-dGTP pyrophosphatase MutT (NUDIX family)
MNFEEKISLIRAEFQNPLPGPAQQFLMAPEIRRKFNFSSPAKKAAVMICLFPGKDDLQIVFMKRNEYDGPHSGQISFPGGAWEELDNDLEETAIRETHEELGVDCSKSALLGALTPLLIPVSNTLVHPFVGYFGNNPVFTADKSEVEFLIISSLSELLDPSCIHKEKWKLHEMEIEVPFYKVNESIIWGATAMILCEFLAIIERSGLRLKNRYSGNDRNDT